MRTIGTLLLLPVVALLSPALQGGELADTSADDESVEVFVAPSGMPAPPRYPLVRQRQGREGWVNVNFMVDPEGRPYEIAVVDSIGDPEFERAAVEAVERTTFQPATLGARAIDAGRRLLMVFQLDTDERGARPSFTSRYRKVLSAVEAGDRQQAGALLDALDAENLYEHAYLSLARYSVATRWGSEYEQLGALTEATRFEGDMRYLPDDLLSKALQSKLVLEVRLQHFAAALDTWEDLRQVGMPAEAEPVLSAMIDEVLQLRADERAFALRGRVGPGASWFHRLLKNRFQIDVDHGEVAELKLRCDRDYLLFRYQPDMEYRIAEHQGLCGLEVVGNPGTTFTLVQR